MGMAFGFIFIVSEGFNVNPVPGNPFSNKNAKVGKRKPTG